MSQSDERVSSVPFSELGVKQFKALSDNKRITIIQLLSVKGKLCVCDLENLLAMSQSKLSYHLKVLYDAELIHKESSATWSYYWINQDALNRLLSEEMLKCIKDETILNQTRRA